MDALKKSANTRSPIVHLDPKQSLLFSHALSVQILKPIFHVEVRIVISQKKNDQDMWGIW